MLENEHTQQYLHRRRVSPMPQREAKAVHGSLATQRVPRACLAKCRSGLWHSRDSWTFKSRCKTADETASGVAQNGSALFSQFWQKAIGLWSELTTSISHHKLVLELR